MATSFEIRSQMRAKVALYLDQGAREVWMVFETETVRFRSGGRTRPLGFSDRIPS